MGFADPIANGIGQLIRAALQSDNFVAGVAGWIIRKTGSAEFNSVTVRGALDVGTATQYVKVFNAPFPIGGPVVAFNVDSAAFPTDAFIEAIYGMTTAYGVLFMASPYDPGSASQGPAQVELISGDSLGVDAPVVNVFCALVAGDTTIGGIGGVDADLTVTGNMSVAGIGQRQYAEVAVDQPVTNNAVLQNCTDLVLPVVAGASYRGELVTYYTAPLGNDLDYAWTTPAGTTGKRGTLSPDITSAAGNVIVVNDRVSSSFLTRFSCGGSGATFRQVREAFTITTTTAGNVQFQFCQRVAAPATSATVLAGSNLTMERVG